MLNSFPECLTKQVPGIDFSNKNWTAASEERNLVFGSLEWDLWRWHIVIDFEGIPESLQDQLLEFSMSPAAESSVRKHEFAVLIYLIAAPPHITPWEAMRALCVVAWAWLDAGATAVYWPEGHTGWSTKDLRDVHPKLLTVESIDYFVNHGPAGSADNDREIWMRTWGMGQFGAPDLACLSSRTEDSLEAADVLLMSMKTYLSEAGGPLPAGDTIELEHRLWKASAPRSDSLPEFLNSRHGIQIFERIQ